MMKCKALVVLLATLSIACSQTSTTAPEETSAPSFAFDANGYNDVANIFVGAADGVDRVLDGKLWGDETYANDHLVMKWNKVWEVCNANRSPENCAGAWINNEWNGQVVGGSGETWHYKIAWIGSCGSIGTSTGDGGYCIWNEYEVLLSHGTADQHFWDAHAKPNGLGTAP